MKRIIPDFFIIGGPKCGTTSLATYLSEHLNILISDPKEPFFFSTDFSFGMRSWDEYNRCYSQLTNAHEAIGEASVDYLFSSKAVPNILKVNPSAKFIVIVRNPIDLAYSLHSQLLWSGIENISDFWKAFNTSSRSRGLLGRVTKSQNYWLQYKEVCSLGNQIERLYANASRDQVMIIVFDDFKKDIKSTYERVINFLNVPQDGKIDFQIYNENKEARSRTLTLLITALVLLKKNIGINNKFGIANRFLSGNTKNSVRPKMSAFIRNKLSLEFKEDIFKLSEILDRDLSGWLDSQYDKEK